MVLKIRKATKKEMESPQGPGALRTPLRSVLDTMKVGEALDVCVGEDCTNHAQLANAASNAGAGTDRLLSVQKNGTPNTYTVICRKRQS